MVLGYEVVAEDAVIFNRALLEPGSFPTILSFDDLLFLLLLLLLLLSLLFLLFLLFPGIDESLSSG